MFLTNCAAGWAPKSVVSVELEIDTILESLPFLICEKITPLGVALQDGEYLSKGARRETSDYSQMRLFHKGTLFVRSNVQSSVSGSSSWMRKTTTRRQTLLNQGTNGRT